MRSSTLKHQTQHSRLALLPVFLALVFTLAPLTGCGGGVGDGSAQLPSAAAQGGASEAPATATDTDGTASSTAQPDTDGTASVSAGSAFDYSLIPDYSGTPYAVVSDNAPSFCDVELTSLESQPESYSPLDSLGRCGAAMAMVSTDTMPTEERGSIGMVKPSGWHTVRYDDLVDGKYLYNRCHLVGYQLTGENANECNLVTGTRYMNVDGMLPFENEVADYVESTGKRVLYRVTPVFIEDELVCRGVHMEARSVDDDGASFSFDVFCYNVQPGVQIDYLTGDSWRLSDASVPSDSSSSSSQHLYVLNTNTGKFHLPSCNSVSRMSERNKREVTSTHDEMVSQGYSPCANCNP